MAEKQKYVEITNQLYETISNTQTLKAQAWLEYVFLSPLWWFGIFLSVVPWIFWIKFHNKNSRHRMLFVGFFVLIIASFLDFLGTQLGLWLYYFEVFPWLPAYEPWDWTLLPVVIMGLIEYKPNKSPIIKALIFAVVTAFIAEPFFKYIGLYNPLHWSVFYSFPIYFILFLFCYWISRRNNFDIYWSE